MSADIISTLQLDKEFCDGRMFVAKELKECDSSFLTSCILGHCIKNKLPTLLILTHKSVTHYHNVGLRMFYNLNKSIETGLMDNYDLGKEYIHNLLDGNTIIMNELWKNIDQRVTSMVAKHGNVNIILDGITHLFGLQYNLNEINWLCRQLLKTVRSMKNSFVLLHCNVSSEDDVTHVLTSLLSHMAYTVLEVENLATGLSADVSGHLTVMHPGKKFEDEQIALILDPRPLQYHFKLFDKGVKLFAPGTI